MNKVILTNAGFVRDPEIRYSNGEKPMAIARFSLAVDKNFKKNKDDAPNYINCVAFGGVASVIEKHCKKGTRVCVEGEWTTGSYEKDGKKVYTNDCNVSKLEFCGSKSDSDSRPNAPDNFVPIIDSLESELPFR